MHNMIVWSRRPVLRIVSVACCSRDRDRLWTVGDCLSMLRSRRGRHRWANTAYLRSFAKLMENQMDS